MDSIRLWLWIGFIGMVIGSIIFGLKAWANRKKESMEFPLVSFFITLWAAIMYLSMILGETVLTNFNGHSEIFIGRYLDWAVTTPLLLLDLGTIAGAGPKLVAGLMGADFFMILTGAIAALERSPNKFLWYLISCGAFLVILIALLQEFTATAHRRNGKVYKLFKQQRDFLIVLWVIYPIVWILAPEGINLIGLSLSTALYAILDISAKVIYGLRLNSTHQDVLAQASRSSHIREAVQSYVETENP